MTAKAPPVTPETLEAALSKAENSFDSHRNILEMLFNARVYVVLDRPWSGGGMPNKEIQVMMVSDGGNREQPMLALFTSPDKPESIARGDSLFQYTAEVEARWALLKTDQQTGIVINPTTIPTFRILPEMACKLRALAEQYLASHL
ncbi:MAG: SseB family protein [Gammaproteobacteria bacterium]